MRPIYSPIIPSITIISPSKKVIKDNAGKIVDDLQEVKLPQDGHDIKLSIDSRIQYLTYRELAKSIETHKAKAGSAIVLDAKTGEILAMANLPSYNPNNLNESGGPTRNRAVTDVFEPGSTIKPFVALAGLVGSGRSEVARAIFGVDRYDSGSITVNSRGLNVGSPSAAMNAGIALVPEDRRQQGDGESVWAGGANHYIITRPPSTPSTCPVTYEASRDAR